MDLEVKGDDEPQRRWEYAGRNVFAWAFHFFEVVICSAFATTFIITKEALVDNGNYMQRCDDDDECRNLLINQLTFIGATALNASGLFAGPLVMKYGTQMMGRVSAPIWMLSMAALYFTDDSPIGHYTRCALLALSCVAGVQIFYVALYSINNCNQREGDQLRTLLTMLWDISSATGFMIVFVYHQTGLEPFTIIAYFGIGAGVYGVMVSLFLTPEVRASGESKQVTSISMHYKEAFKAYFQSRQTTFVSLCFLLNSCLFLVTSYFFFATVRERILERDDISENDADRHNRVFGIAVSGLSMVVFRQMGNYVSRYNRSSFDRPKLFLPLLVMQIITTIIAALVTVIPSQIQYVGYIIFGTYRIYYFSMFNSLIPSYYGQPGYTIMGINYAIGAIFTFFNPFLDHFTVRTLNQYWPVDVVLNFMLFLSFISCIYALKKSHSSQYSTIN